MPPRFDPEAGRTVVEPPGTSYGYWAGAPSAILDPDSGKLYLYHRLRTPRLEGRGGECRIAASSDGERFETVWSARKEDFGAQSIERASIIRDPGGRWRLYISYEVGSAYDRNPPSWRVDLLEADSPEGFDPALARPVIDGLMFGYTFVKDPTVVIVGGEYNVFASVGLPPEDRPDDRASGEGGVRVARPRGWTALFRSADGVRFSTARIVLSPPACGWDAFQRRLTSVCYLPPVWCAFYDGATHRADSYDEFTGLLVSEDLVHFRCVTPDRPWVRSPHGSGSIRYLDALPLPDGMRYFYEYVRADGAHELRQNAVPWSRG